MNRPDAIRRLCWQGRVFEPGGRGRIVNGGSWLEIDGQKVDLIDRDLDVVSKWTSGRTRSVCSPPSIRSQLLDVDWA